VKHEGGLISEVAAEFPILQFNFRYAPVGKYLRLLYDFAVSYKLHLEVLESEGVTRFTRDAPFSGLPITDLDFDTGSELLDEKEKVQFRQLKVCEQSTPFGMYQINY
jgi:hypothetical protein